MIGQTRQRSPSCWTVERTRYLAADLACVFCDALQSRLKVFDLNAESFLEILCTQKLFHEVMVCCDLPLKVCLEIGYSIFIGTRKASHGLFNHVDVALRRALHLFEIFKHHSLNGFKRALFVSHVILQRRNPTYVYDRDQCLDSDQPLAIEVESDRNANLAEGDRVGELRIGAAPVPPLPAERNGALGPGAEVVAAAACREEWRVDTLDVDTAIMRRLDAVCNLDQLARAEIGLAKRRSAANFFTRHFPCLGWALTSHGP
jgi:hypothetical protein